MTADPSAERPATQRIRVMVVDDHMIVRAGLEQLMGTTPDLEFVGSAADGSIAQTEVARLKPDVVLMDLSMPNLDGAEATRLLKESHPDLVVIVLTSFSERSRILDAISAGADGYLLKHANPDELIEAIRAAARGGAPLDPQAARILLDARGRTQAAADQLTDREREVLGLVRDGLANKQIARKLTISERTVKAHLTNIFHRIGVTDRTQAAIWAVENLG